MKNVLYIIIIALICWEIPGQAGNDGMKRAGNGAERATKEEAERTEGKKKIIKGFSGGMMAHTGYQWGGDNPYNYNPKGMTFGIGGVARLHLTDHFRTGFEGYFSNVGLKKNIESGSHNKVFWAGVLADHYWSLGKFYPYAGLSVGGGMETSCYIFEGNKHDWLPEGGMIYHKQGFFAVDPFIGCDFAVGEALRLTLKADWLMAIRKEGLNKPLGPRIYFGVIFAR
jgi:hypothetical protein